MKTFIATLIATAVSAVVLTPAGAAPVDKEAYRTAMDKAAADYRSAKAKCDAQSGNPGIVCQAEASLARANAEAAAVAAYDNTGNKLQQARTRVVQAQYDVAQRKCDRVDASTRDICLADAKTERHLAMGKLEGASDGGAGGSAGLVAGTGTTDPAKAAAVEKCEQHSGDARTACLVDNRGQATTVGDAASANAAAIAANTREAAAHAAQNTREAARSAADKTREVASSVAEKTGVAGAGERTREAVATVKEKTAAAVERTKEMASNAAHKTEDATERVGERTARVAADSAITTKVKAGLVADPALKGMEISVDTEHGVVMLSGFVESKAEADKALQVAKGVKGVSSVKSAIKVK